MQTLDLLKSRLNPVVILLAQENEGKVSLVAGISQELTRSMVAPDLIKAVGAIVGARGGGSPVLARAGGGDAPEKLGDAMSMVADWVRERSNGAP